MTDRRGLSILYHKHLISTDSPARWNDKVHEFSAACSIVETAVDAAKNHHVKRVVVVNVDVGEFTFLIPEQLEFNFEIASRGTVLEGARLNIRSMKGQLKCKDCGHEGKTRVDDSLPPQVALFAPMKCSKCGSSATVITGGKEFIITNIEAEIENMSSE